MSDAQVKFLTLGYEPASAGEEARFSFKCPKHATNRCEGLLIRSPLTHNVRPAWIWDGNRDAPTFSPSINCGSCPGRWHGFIEAGRCVDTSHVDEAEPA